MDPSPSGSFVLIFMLIVINGFFSASEMALISLDKTKINFLVEQGHVRAKLVQKLLAEPSNFLATIQVGITLAGFFASAQASMTIADDLSLFLKLLYIPYSKELAVVMITVVVSYLTLVFGELIPKRIAILKSESVAFAVIKPIIFISSLTRPFVILLSGSTNLFLKVFRMNTNEFSDKVSREQLKSIVEIGEEHGAINETELEMIQSIIRFDDTLAKEIMTPRTETFLLEINANLKDYISIILEENFSRIPVYEKDIDNIVGILYMKDLFSSIIRNGIDNLQIKTIMREPCLIPEIKNIDDVFKILNSTQNHIAILIDEYGGFSGIVTLEDLIEEVMGEILDEYDEEKPKIQVIDEYNYLVNGLISIDDLNQYFNFDFSSDTADTLGGFFIEHLGALPSEFDYPELNINDVLLKLVKLDDKRIDTIQIVTQRNRVEKDVS